MWLNNTCLARQVADLRKTEPTSARSRALAAVTAGYKRLVALQQDAGHDSAMARRLVVDQLGERGKALRLPHYGRLAFDGKTG